MGAQLSNINRNSSKRSRAMLEINMTPLIDVMLVLLITFMITAPMLLSGIDVDLPKVSSSPTISGDDKPLTISIDKEGNTYILDMKIDRKHLSSKLRAVTNENFDTRILIRGDQNIPYGEIVKVFVQVTESGFSKVALITDSTYDTKN